MVVAFPGNQFTGEIAPALADLVESKTIRIIDLAFVSKDAEGNIAALELSDLDPDVAAAFGSTGAGSGMLFNDDDLEAAGDELEPNCSAALLVWEDLWATRLAEAIRNAGGEVYDLDRIPHDVVVAAMDYAKTNAAG
jgi:hypothetical protein